MTQLQSVGPGPSSQVVAPILAVIGLRLKFGAGPDVGKLVLAGAADKAVGQNLRPTAVVDYRVSVKHDTPGCASIHVAVDAIAKGAPVFAAADGKVSAAGAVQIGHALTASTADNDQIDVLRLA